MSPEESCRPRLRGGRRVFVVCLLGTAAAVVCWAAVTVWPHFKVRVYERRISAGVNPQGNLRAIAELEHPAAIPALEGYALRGDQTPYRDGKALELLVAHYPDSQFARGVTEWQQVREGQGYFSNWGGWRLWQEWRNPNPTRIPGLRGWLARYPRHPGRDDGYLVLGIDHSRLDPVEALRCFHRGLSAPDGDKRSDLKRAFLRLLAEHASGDQLVGWLAADCPGDVRSSVLYSAAVHRLREHRFEDASDLFAQLDKRQAEGATEWIEVPTQVSQEQSRACQELLEQSQAAARASSREARAAILHAMGRRAFHEEKLFAHRLHREPTVIPEARWKGETPLEAEDISPGNHYQQAGLFFRQIAREYPDYSQIEAVEYSIPLCLWRLRGNWPVSVGRRLREAIQEGFQAFADRHPRSSMADDALYLAGIEHYYANGCRDDGILRRNFARLVAEYPEGDILERYLPSSDRLQRAVASRRFPELDQPGRQGAAVGETD